MKKRIICLVIAFLLLLTLVSCEKEPTLLDITQGVNRNWDSYNQILYYANLETHTAKKAEDVSVFYRCVQEVSFDVVDADGYKASHGLYCYDLSVFLDGMGSLHYRHYVYEPYPNYTLDQEEKVDLTVEEVSSFQSVLREYDFENIPAWDPDDRSGTGTDGGTTYIIGVPENTDFAHFVALWGAQETDGIYQIRTAIENLVREKIEVTSGRVYVDYE